MNIILADVLGEVGETLEKEGVQGFFEKFVTGITGRANFP